MTHRRLVDREEVPDHRDPARIRQAPRDEEGGVMSTKAEPRTQCKSCPWKTSVDPDRLPGAYGHVDRSAVAATLTGDRVGPVRGMGCHVGAPGPVLPCVGWVANQLAHGNIALRLAVIMGHVDGNVRTVGPQRETLT